MSGLNQDQSSTSSDCVICHRTTPIKRCARCQTTQYCSADCQRSDWTSHKQHCHPSTPPSGIWYDKYRKCKDGNEHEGELELITWSTPANEHEDWSEDMGWGNIIVAEAEDHKRKFETEMNGDEAKLYKYWPQAFRWTCCGTGGEQRYGCDHHGSGSNPCTCDFCKVSGQQITNLLVFVFGGADSFVGDE
ncbi:MAG: hypothetical protein LQ349_009017 [Xanthoria aureola]|nr:MAG: hypothetical protein LQ349_009017 [Xanthoria aureola]